MRVGKFSYCGVRHPERGYSLAELLVVVTIIGMVSLVSVPQFINMMRNGRVKSSLRQFNGDVRAARARSITQNIPTRITFLAGNSEANREFRLYDGILNPATGAVDWNAASVSTPVLTRQIEESVFFYQTDFTDQNADGRPDIVFRPNGTVANVPTGNLFGYVRIKTNWNIPIDQYEIRVNTTGRIEVVPQ
jgi:prepilin-type N-terminal cleavage/methylation domain-containing protein